MTSITWIYNGSISEPARILAGALTAKGWEVAWLSSVTQTIPECAATIFVTGWDAAAVTQVIATSRALPVIAVESSDASGAALIEAGVDDLFLLGDDAGGLAARIEIRIRQARGKMELVKRFQDQTLETAKAETAMKQREEFLSVCAHDLRSPLGLIQTSLSMVLNGQPALPALPSELITRARRQAGQAIKLVNDLLDVMALEQGLKPQYEVLNMHKLLDEFYRDYKLQADQKKIRFHYENPIPSWRILADADRVRQLLQNLLGNALKFTDEGKNIYLSVAPFQGRRRADPPYPMIVMSLRDEGKGIPSTEVQKIFDRFAQLKQNSREGGRGLGLTVAKQISTLHDGNVWVQSVEGQGSTFFALFPHVLSAPAATTATKKILIAEPSFQKRDLFYKQMEKWGYELLFARDGIEALTLSFYTRPSLVILTKGLAKLQEAEVANVIKNDPEMSGTKVLLAAEADQLSQSKSEVTLFDESLPLPFTKEGFESTLLSLADRINQAA